MKVLLKKLLIVALLCLNTGGVFAKTTKSSSLVDQSLQLAKDKVREQEIHHMVEQRKKDIMDACQKNINAILALTEPSGVENYEGKRLVMLNSLRDATETLLHLQKISSDIVRVQ